MRLPNLRAAGLCLAVALADICGAVPPPQSPPPPISSKIATGDQYWANGKLDEAERAFSDAFVAAPKSVTAGMKLAGIRLSRQNYPAAIETYQRVIGIGEPNAKAWIGMGVALMHTGKQEMARAAFEEAIKIEPARKQDLDPLIAKASR